MKTHRYLAGALCALSLAALSLTSTGCATLDPGQQIALANAAAGNAVATYLLGKNGAAAVQPLNDLAAKLPLIVEGKVTAYQLGQLNAELQGVQSGVSGTNQQLFDQAGSLIALISKSAADATGGALTPQQAVLLGYCQNVAQGIQNAVQYWQGGHGGPAPAS